MLFHKKYIIVLLSITLMKTLLFSETKNWLEKNPKKDFKLSSIFINIPKNFYDAIGKDYIKDIYKSINVDELKNQIEDKYQIKLTNYDFFKTTLDMNKKLEEINEFHEVNQNEKTYQCILDTGYLDANNFDQIIIISIEINIEGKEFHVESRELIQSDPIFIIKTSLLFGKKILNKPKVYISASNYKKISLKDVQDKNQDPFLEFIANNETYNNLLYDPFIPDSFSFSLSVGGILGLDGGGVISVNYPSIHTAFLSGDLGLYLGIYGNFNLFYIGLDSEFIFSNFFNTFQHDNYVRSTKTDIDGNRYVDIYNYDITSYFPNFKFNILLSYKLSWNRNDFFFCGFGYQLRYSETIIPIKIIKEYLSTETGLMADSINQDDIDNYYANKSNKTKFIFNEAVFNLGYEKLIRMGNLAISENWTKALLFRMTGFINMGVGETEDVLFFSGFTINTGIQFVLGFNFDTIGLN